MGEFLILVTNCLLGLFHLFESEIESSFWFTTSFGAIVIRCVQVNSSVG